MGGKGSNQGRKVLSIAVPLNHAHQWCQYRSSGEVNLKGFTQSKLGGAHSRVQPREEERGPWTYDCYASNRVSPTKTHGGLVSKATVLEIVGLSGKIDAFFLGSSSWTHQHGLIIMTVGCYKAGLSPPFGLSGIHAYPNALVPHFLCVLALYDALTRSLADVRPHSWSFITARDK
jgi:hypothetical protein